MTQTCFQLATGLLMKGTIHEIVETFLNGQFEDRRHQTRIDMLTAVEA